MSTYQELQEQIARFKEEAAAARKLEVQEAITAIHEKMAQYDLTVADLGLSTEKSSKTKSGKAKAIAKYRDPATGKTWSGRGRAPLWLQGDVSQYLIG